MTLSCPISRPAQAGSSADNFAIWLHDFRTEALAAGVTPDTFDAAFQGVAPIAKVIELDGRQPERTHLGFATYLKNVMTQKRIDQGRSAMAQNRPLLWSVSQAYGVPPEVVVALWGIETSYGQNTGNYDLVSALATLAWEGRRASFFKKELIAALLILQGGHIDRADFKGSWAGAMGQNQFMPSSWQRFAVDFNGDGHKDIWTSRSDVFASSANYLAKNGWNPQIGWGWQVIIPTVSLSKFRSDQTMPYQDWLNSGIKFRGNLPSLSTGTPLKLVIPDGADGRYYLVTQNFDVIKSWNRSNYFALTVGLLSDFISQTPSGDISRDMSDDSRFNQ